MLKKVFFIFLLVAIFSTCKKEVIKESKKEILTGSFTEITSVKTVNYNQLKPLLEKKDDKTYIINFWATWCAPCVKELPYFERITKEYADKNVEVLLVSLDFPKQVDKKLIPFINKRKLKSEVIYFNDINEDVWIKDIEESWSGAIPATIIYNKSKRKFYEQSFDYQTLENELKTFLKPFKS
ncbi:TlpA disulfide reductase family protein [uncultured Polaribacter sp.]|uniref:TlpA disulfide reductase family protein n=1 Tax=uncultured Polaribacter sp. TaxID=174711 RepID=UPI00260B8CBE|nr:TlpA disulfide reductase family protein [uncultured Polaribacter sp.]